MGAECCWRASPNCGPRRGGQVPRLVVLHYTAMDSAERAADWLCSPESQVSAHYLIDECGTVLQMVDEAARAWHAGAGEWAGCDDVNSRSIGIELANTGAHPFAAAQMDALESLLKDIMIRWSIPPEGVIGHSCMAPGRKTDPGARFDWRRLARAGLAVWPRPAAPIAPDMDRFRALAQSAGFTAPCDDATLVSVVRLRFRPWGRGALTGADMVAIGDIAARFGVDRVRPTA